VKLLVLGATGRTGSQLVTQALAAGHKVRALVRNPQRLEADSSKIEVVVGDATDTAEACRRVGKDAHAVAAVARDLGVGWATIMRAVADHGTPLVDDPMRLDGVATLGLDETTFLKATRLAPTRWVTGLVDLEQGRLLDVVADRTRAAVDRWLGARPRGWLAQVGTVALDPGAAMPARWSPRSATPGWSWTTSTPSGWPTWWSTRSAGGPSRPPSAPGTQTRSAVPHPQAAEQLTSRGRVRLRAGLAAGDPTGEVAVAWQGKELLRAVYAAGDLAHAGAALGRLYRWSDGVGVAELSRLAHTVRAWEAESSPSTPPAAAPTARPRP
jgi:transposase